MKQMKKRMNQQEGVKDDPTEDNQSEDKIHPEPI